MKTLKTCKTGCGKMKSGGAVKKVKKMAQGGQMYGIPQTGPTGPNIQGVDTMKKGGMVKKYQRGGGIDDPKNSKDAATIKSPAQTLGSMSGKDYRTLKKGVKREQKLARIESGKQGERVDNVIRAVASGADAASSTLRAAQSAKELIKNKKGGTIKKYQGGGYTNTTPGEISTGMMKKGGAKKMAAGGSLKPVPSNKVGLSKLPTAVRNKMGFQKKGGPIKKK